ncbi:MAG: hypothetical protein IT334_00855 [Thermomicrobiales bacterium]|nr:hypothetical protein [Thermomicrobiales bacterium]
MQRIPTNAVRRDRLLDLMDQPQQAPVTLVVAPAGYGKSTLVRQWVASRNARVLWVDLRPEDNSPGALTGQIWRKLNQIQGMAGSKSEPVDFPALQARFRHLPDKLTLVLDNFHAITDECTLDVIGQYLKKLPVHLHVVLVGRRTPELSLARLRAYGFLRQITYTDLAFTIEELRLAFRDFELSDDQLAQFHQRSGGWVTALKLMLTSISPADEQDNDRFAGLIEGLHENPLLEAFVIEEIIELLPREHRDFLLDTVHLESLHPDLCDAVLEIEESAAVLRQLVNGIPLIEQPSRGDQWYRFDSLFAEIVQRHSRRLHRPQRPEELLTRAAHWYERQGDLDRAVDCALRAEQWDEATRLLKTLIAQDTDRARIHDALELSRAFPKAVLRADPELLHSAVMASISAGDIIEARRFSSDYAKLVHTQLPPIVHGRHSLHLAMLAVADGHSGTVVSESLRALAQLPPDAAIDRMLAWTNLYRSAGELGDIAFSEAALEQAEACQERLPESSLIAELVIAPVFANAAAISGDLNLAEHMLRYVHDHLPRSHAAARGEFRTRLIPLYIEQNRIEEAVSEAAQLLRQLDRHPAMHWYPEALRAIANVHLLQDQPDKALPLLQRALTMSRDRGAAALNHRLEALIALLWLRTEQTDLARLWWSRREGPIPFSHAFGDDQLAKVELLLLLHDDRYDGARQVVAGILETARRLKHVAAEIEFSVWASIIAEHLGDKAGGEGHLIRALTLGEPGKFHQSYHPAGFDVRESIRAVASRLAPAVQAFALEIAGRPEPEIESEIASALANLALTPRELAVLEELRAGKSNREIADSLFITERTVKKYVASLIQKSGATNRTGVVLWALNLTRSSRRPAR